jgi:hypothetical protein
LALVPQLPFLNRVDSVINAMNADVTNNLPDMAD